MFTALITRSVQGALQWLEDNQDKSLEDIKAPAAKGKDHDDDPNELPPNLMEGEVAKSLVCNECGKRFRSHAQAEFHASKTLDPHFNFAARSYTILTSVLGKENTRTFLSLLKRFHSLRKKSRSKS